MTSVFRKQRAGAPAGYFAAEAVGLDWLAEAKAVPVVRVISVTDRELALERLREVAPSPASALTFGENLARLHDAGAPAFGFTPASRAWFGPLDHPFEVVTSQRTSFAQYWADDRLTPLLWRAWRVLGEAHSHTIERAIARIREGAFDGIAGGPAEKPARLHGDLWSGNVMWTAEGATLIDPSAHGGHRLEDLSMLALFGAPHLEQIFAGYEHAHPLPRGWRADIPAHQLYGLLAHVALFGSSYVAPTLRAAEAIVKQGAS